MKKNKNAILITLSLLMLVVSACGGGGDGSDPQKLTGFWENETGTTTAIVLDNGEAWVLATDESSVPTTFLHLTTQTDKETFTGSGKQYFLATRAVDDVRLSGTFSEGDSLTGTLTATSDESDLGLLSYNAQYHTAVRLGDILGSWTRQLKDVTGTRALTFNIAETGALVGTSTTGCNYGGFFEPRAADPAVFDVSFSENCFGELAELTGIATLNTAKDQLSVAVTTAQDLQGIYFLGHRQ